MKSCIMWVITIRFKYIDLIVGSCRFATEYMFNKTTTTTNQFRQPIDGVHDSNIAPLDIHVANVKHLCSLYFLLQSYYMCKTY
jgi:hypothetical protein